MQALCLRQTPHARTRRPVAQLLGGHRETGGRWRAIYARGGLPQRLTMAKAPGNPPRLSEGRRQALQERLAQPQGVGSYQALWPWLRQEFGLPRADKPVPKLVRYMLWSFRSSSQGLVPFRWPVFRSRWMIASGAGKSLKRGKSALNSSVETRTIWSMRPQNGGRSSLGEPIKTGNQVLPNLG